MLSKLSMQMVCQIQSGRSLRHGLDFSSRRKDKDFSREEIEFKCVKELYGVWLGIIQYFFDGSEPFVQFVFASFVGFVLPMCGQSSFCDFVHSVGPNLYLHPLSVGSHDGYMKSFVSVCLWRRDPVAYSFGVRAIDFGNGGINHPALVLLRQPFMRCENDSDRHEIVNIFERDSLVLHFFVDRVDGLDSGFHGKLISHSCEFVLDRLRKVFKDLELVVLDGRQFVLYLLVGIGMLVLKAEVFEFGFNGE